MAPKATEAAVRAISRDRMRWTPLAVWREDRRSFNHSPEDAMAKVGAKNDNRRDGAVKKRSQFKNKAGLWVKRDAKTGRILDVKTSGGKFKGVRRAAKTAKARKAKR